MKDRRKDIYEASTSVMYKDGISVLKPDNICLIGLKGDTLEFKADDFRPQAAPAAVMSLSQITGVEYFSETEMVEKSKSVVGRSIVGGLVFGPVGAIVGGLSGTQNKKVEESRYFLVLNYIPSGKTEPVAATFEDVVAFNNVRKLVAAIKARIPKSTKPAQTVQL